MWAANPEDGLRQGDLLGEVPFPTLKIEPAVISRLAGQPATEAVVTIKYEKALVVSQCCSLEKGRTVLVAPVAGVRPRNAAGTQSLKIDDPTPDAAGDLPDGVGYVYERHRLDLLPGYLDELDDRLWVANFERIIPLREDYSSVEEIRLASMTPEGRRTLRIRLGFFWGRAEEGDAETLTSRGLPVGHRFSTEQAALGVPRTTESGD